MDEVVERYSIDNEIAISVAKEHEMELKKYLALCAIHPEKNYGMNGQIDELWHTFIFFTKEYIKFCKDVAGRYIHHVPNTKKEIKNEVNTYKTMIYDYKIIFNEEPPKHIWPSIKKDENLNDECNTCGSSCGTSCNTCGVGDPSCGSGCSQCSSCGS